MKKLSLYLFLLLIASALTDCRKEEVILQAPDVTTFLVTDIGYHSATCGGAVTGTNIISRGMCWSIRPTPTIADSVTLAGNENGSFSVTLNQLKSDSTYYIRAFATNSVGTAYGSIMQIKTKPTKIEVTTAPISDIGYQSASCGGTVSCEGTTITTCGICWSTHAVPTLKDSSTVDSKDAGSFTSFMPSLKSDSTYYVRAYAANSTDTVYGSTMKFKTKHAVLIVKTLSTVNASLTSLSCQGTVFATSGVTILSRGICYSPYPFPTIDDHFVQSTETTTSFSGNIVNLSANQSYYVRAYATTYNQTIYGENLCFRTRSNPVIVSGPQLVELASTRATVSATISGTEAESVISRGVCWNKTGNPTISESRTNDGPGSLTINSIMIGLSPATTYYMRSYVQDKQGLVYGPTNSFRTNETNSVGAPSVVILYSERTGAGTTFQCKIAFQGASPVTEYGYYISSTANPSATNHIQSSSLNGSPTTFSFTLNLNIPGYTTTYIRIFAKNANGTGYSETLIYNYL